MPAAHYSDKDEAADGPESCSNAAPASHGTARPKRRRRRRVLGVFLFLIVLLFAAIGFAPALASARVATNLLVPMVNDRIQGRITLGKLTLSWFGTCGVKDVTVADPAGREVLRVNSVTIGSGIWAALTSTVFPKRIDVDSPRVVLCVADDGEISLAQAFSPRHPVASEEPSEPFSLRDAGVTVRNGAVKMIRADGREYEVPKVRGLVMEYVRMLAGTRVDIPIVGTRRKPVLDFSKVDTGKLLKGIIKDKALGDLLDLLAGRSKKD